MVFGRMTQYSKFHIRTAQGGFGLIELLISIGILLLITSLVMVRQSSFNQSVLLNDQAFEVGFDIRQTQMRAVSPQIGTAGDFRGGYSFAVDSSTPDRYTIYQYTQQGERHTVEVVNIDPRFKLEIVPLLTGEATTQVNQVEIYFERPEFDAVVRNIETGEEIENSSGAVVRICQVDSSTSVTGDDFDPPLSLSDVYNVFYLSIGHPVDRNGDPLDSETIARVMDILAVLGISDPDDFTEDDLEAIFNLAFSGQSIDVSGVCHPFQSANVQVTRSGQINIQ